MVIKEVNLETVCGVTSKLSGEYIAGGGICRKIQCWKVIIN